MYDIWEIEVLGHHQEVKNGFEVLGPSIQEV